MPPQLVMGTYANALRVVQDADNEYFLDFLVYSSFEKKAVVCARLRINEILLQPLIDRFQSVLDVKNGKASPPEVRKPHLIHFPIPAQEEPPLPSDDPNP